MNTKDNRYKNNSDIPLNLRLLIQALGAELNKHLMLGDEEEKVGDEGAEARH